MVFCFVAMGSMGILAPQERIELTTLALESEVLTDGPLVPLIQF